MPQVNDKTRMKTNRTISLLLACLAGACFFISQAAAATLTGTVATPTPSTPVNLTAEGTLDWAEWGFGGKPDAFNDMAPGVVRSAIIRKSAILVRLYSGIARRESL